MKNSEIHEDIREILEITNENERQFGWLWVKSLAELQILTKASYTLLFIVPLLASIWKILTAHVNTLNASVLVGVVKLEQLSMNDGIDPVEHNNLFENTIDVLLSGLNHALIKSVTMPSIWAYAFLASLAAVLAQLMYQVWCPEPVKTMTLRSYIFSRLDSVKKVEDSYKVRNAASIASLEYKKLETLAQPAFLACFALYTISIFTLLYVVVLQSLNVGVAVGWEWAGCLQQKLT